MAENSKSMSFASIITKAVFRPSALWKEAVEKKCYSHLWLIFLLFTNITSLAYITGGAANFIKMLISLNFLLWFIILSLWVFISGGLKVAGVKTTLNFKNILRLVSYSSAINIFYFLVQIVFFIIHPKFFIKLDIYAPDTYTYKKFYPASLIFEIIGYIFILWSLVLVTIGVKHLFRISYKRAILSVVFIPLCVFLVIISIIALSSLS